MDIHTDGAVLLHSRKKLYNLIKDFRGWKEMSKGEKHKEKENDRGATDKTQNICLEK